eukprot:6182066-Pleurochrysis_carterae.AAC.1
MSARPSACTLPSRRTCLAAASRAQSPPGRSVGKQGSGCVCEELEKVTASTQKIRWVDGISGWASGSCTCNGYVQRCALGYTDTIHYVRVLCLFAAEDLYSHEPLEEKAGGVVFKGQNGIRQTRQSR